MNPVDLTLYGILDPERSRGRPLPQLAAEAVRGGATLLQLRDKFGDTRRMVDSARAIRAAIAGSGVQLLVNDRVDVALAAEAEGVHLGQDDMAIADARRIMGPDAIIGLSIKTLDEARAAPVELLDYACIGGVFDTASKDNPTSIGVAGWAERAEILRSRAPDMPVGAIAGIDATNTDSLIGAGADGVAIISALFMAPDVAAATRELAAIIAEARKL